MPIPSEEFSSFCLVALGREYSLPGTQAKQKEQSRGREGDGAQALVRGFTGSPNLSEHFPLSYKERLDGHKRKDRELAA